MARASTHKSGKAPPGLFDKFEQYLQKQSLRLTDQRRKIIDKILAMKRHFTADDLVDSFRDERPRVSKATVYRTLGLLAGAGILEEHHFGDAFRYYEIAEGRDHHDHLCCTSCGKIIEFFNPEMERLQDEVAAKLGFEPHFHSQKIYGTCKECRKSTR